MGLNKAQSTAFEKARAPSSGSQGVGLSDDSLRALVALVARDLGLPLVEGVNPLDGRGFYEMAPDEVMANGEATPRTAYNSLLNMGPDDTVTYFSSLATLHRARMKFANIMRLQTTPTLEQVGPRGLLQFGSISTEALASLLIVRKWLYDIDNRAAQETGYLFEPVIANAVGGISRPAHSSPVKREGTGAGRQVDCLLDNRAYEIKMRVTIAHSGQGRWKEELTFPSDCKASGYKPVLVVFDSTENPKLLEIREAFMDHDGEVYIGRDAWDHLEDKAGTTMGTFIRKYIRAPLENLLNELPDVLPAMNILIQPESVRIGVGREELLLERRLTSN